MRILVVGLLLVSLGNYYHNLMQGFAWGGMIVMFAQDETLEQSFSKTFSGDSLCSLCLAIEDSRGSLPENDQTDEIERSLKRELSISPVRDVQLFQSYVVLDYRTPTLIWSAQADLMPPTPPPKQV